MPGQGSFFRRKSDGRWVAAISVGSREDRVVHRRYVHSRDAAKAALVELQAELEQPASTMTLGAYLRRWLDESAKPSIRPNTYRGYDVIVRTHVAHIAHVPLNVLSPEHIEAALNAMDGAPKTVRNAQLMLRRALRVAEERGYLRRNPARLVPLRKVPRPNETALTAVAAQAIRAAVAGDRYAAAVDLALCGLRSGEVLGLAWEDVDLAGATVTVRYALARRDGRYVRDDVKSAASAAMVPLPAFVVASLTAHETCQREERIAAGRPTERGLVFVTPSGRPVNGSWLTKHFQSLLRVVGLPSMRFHGLRHGTATLLAAAGVHPRVA